MQTDVEAARQFVLANATLLDRRRMAVLLDGASPLLVVGALRQYQNEDGGFGNALEPDIRGPESQPVAALRALEVLAESGFTGDPMMNEVARWIGSIAEPDGGVGFVLDTPAKQPHAPWMVPTPGGSHLTFGLAAALIAAGSSAHWVPKGAEWCWRRLAGSEEISAYWLKFAMKFLDVVEEEERAEQAIDNLKDLLGTDGSIEVPGGVEGERLTPLDLSPRPNTLSRKLFTEEQINVDLDVLQEGQQADGGWNFDWLGWSPGQIVEWRGALTVDALATLAAHGRINLR